MNWMNRRFRKNRRARRIDAELQFHLDEQARDGVDSGMSEDEARREARFVSAGAPRLERGIPASGFKVWGGKIHSLKAFFQESFSGSSCPSLMFKLEKACGRFAV